ncbi:MAG: hypothetical protein JO197_02115 [Acidobacteria bacterium]|nr:hypothetical protein [Acidobacteriota bacterium]MBV9476825.1 hypothetical protein [Acidobacteriota bacterium]
MANEGSTLAACVHCGKSNQPVFSAADARRIIQSASGDAFTAIRQITSDPIGGLTRSYATLGEERARAAGIALGVAFALAVGIASAITASHIGFNGIAKLLLGMTVVGLVPFAAMAGVSAGARKAFRADGAFGADLLSCGVALQPFSIVFIIAALLGIANFQTVALVSLFAWTYMLSILFTGCTQLAHIPQRFAPTVIAVMLLAAIWATRVVGGWLLSDDPFIRFFN